MDRSQSIRKPGYYQFDTNVPQASGESNDFTAVSLGAGYQEKGWGWNSRLEYRTSQPEDKWGVLTALVGEPAPGWGWSARLQLFDTSAADGSGRTNGDLRLGLVHRPSAARWIILERLDLLVERQHGASASAGTALAPKSSRIVNNLNASYQPRPDLQLSLQYGAKYVLEEFDGASYRGYTDLIGVEGRYDLNASWDIGLRQSLLHSWNGGEFSYSAGPSVGYHVVKNGWISLGYNFAGFSDRDFSAADFTAQGPFVRFRFKFDQNSVREAAQWINRQ